MFYEAKHSLSTEYCQIENGSCFSFPLHIHGCFEIITVTDGEMEVTVGEQVKVLKKGDAAFIFPNLIHGMKTESVSKHKLCVFSSKLINHYSKKNQSLIPKSPFFTLDVTAEHLLSVLSPESDLCTKKAVLYYLAGLFDRTADFIQSSYDSRSALLYRILKYIEDSYTSECSLKSLSESLKYDYAYLSKYFIKNIKMTFNEYVNQRRISEACYLLSTTESSVLDVSTECGFGSLRSFNRNFLEIMGVTPARYRYRIAK